ncbi:TraR/DksA C4-type zinc finger protein [Nocardia xishanensis]|uniref:TraR/DksA C4-type zinc finger protein n=1 Tax=Nocardia xishanensis TaxID=238964 RepID=UPI000AA9DB99|nr:TraR/DksA C4-type zinc finger protein [Nocardia xishanensis]
MTNARPVSHARLTDHLPALRATLMQQRHFRLQQLADLEAEIDRGAAPANAADTARYEVTIELAAAARQALADIEETLTLMSTGRYGRCRRCHTEIPIHLLQTIPATQWCLNCRRHLPASGGCRPMRRQRPRKGVRTPRPGSPAERRTLA